jgi:DNA replication protein DnaC
MNIEGILDGIEQASGIKAENGDYIKDGLLHCGKCGTPKQVRVEVMGRVRTPLCLCKCESERRDAEQAEYERRQRAERIARMRRVGFPDAELSQCTFAADDGANRRLSTVARRYVENFAEMRERGKGLLLIGKVDAGKTFAAACIANALIDQGKPCLMTNFPRLVNTIGGMYDGKQEYIDGLNRFELLVIDDLASERDTEFMGETVHNVIDARYRSRKPLIVTTNLTSEELKNPQDVRKQRVYSRLLEMCLPVEVQPVGRRKKKFAEDYSELKDMLGL